ncbi:hypothetical protein [Acetohalobium arabaticum]|uniref:Uncharacterized protein n=1 Tax=Acetohalobium arabaticum (strain ATCC 49924 / DSM 5501 / Z-7288) TaxID=574087 RepID=D9QQC8_ACEAZ|nr:hypothetical protein [Acetohalobium arabaticum]ADL12719.1 hypothetical protein Acear_1199 [Acetohalobium arabaticum DSM 5501]
MKKLMVILGIMMLMNLCIISTASAFIGIENLNMLSIYEDSWVLDRFKPLEPGELDVGEYRISTNFGRIINDDYNDYNSNLNNYYIGFDTAFENDWYLNSSYNFTPYYQHSSQGDRSRYDNINLMLTRSFNDDNQFYCGYSRIKNKEKEYDSGEFSHIKKDTNDLFFIGAEFYGSFLD